jgi:hypothetical protein
VEVDTTPPDINIAASFAKDETGRIVSARLAGHADDKNLSSWKIAYRPYDSSGRSCVRPIGGESPERRGAPGAKSCTS